MNHAPFSPDGLPGHDQARMFSDAAFARNLGILTPAEQAALSKAKVAVPGLGGVGGLHCVTLARLGVSSFSLADPDIFEVVNFNRQYGASMRHLGQAKLDSMSEEIRQINPHAQLAMFPDGLNQSNMDAFLSGVNVVVDGLDFFAFDIRRALFNRARELGIAVITAAPLGFTSSVLVFTPDSMGFDDYFGITDAMSRRERLLRFAVGLAPGGLHLGQVDPSRVSLSHGKGPSLGIACLLCAALAATEAVRVVTGRPGLRPAPWSFQVDPNRGKSRWSRPKRGNASLSQRLKLWYVRNMVLGGDAEALRPIPSSPQPVDIGGAVSSEHLEWLVKAAQQAPSGDNCQPWRFTIGDWAIGVRLTPRTDESFFNVHQLASVIACGAAVQNILSAAPGVGLKASAVLMPDSSDEDIVARVELAPDQELPGEFDDAIWSRTTNRRMYAKRGVDGHCQSEMVRAAGPERLLLVSDRRRLRELAGLLFKADRIRVERRDLHEHFVSMTRFDPPDGAGFQDGLPLKNLYAGKAGEVFLRATKSWAAMRAANATGLGRLVAMHSRLSMLSSPLAGLLCVDSPGREAFLRGGMSMQRVWLMATRLGLALQPMTAITLFWLRWRLDGPEVFDMSHRRLLEAVWTGFEKLFPELGGTCWPVMLFRAGHATSIRFGTPRRAVEDDLVLE